VDSSSREDVFSPHTREIRTRNARHSEATERSADPPSDTPEVQQDAAWRGELATRVEAYRVRRRKIARNVGQSQLPFNDHVPQTPPPASVALAEQSAPAEEDFAFTIAIGRIAKKPRWEDTRMEIDVSMPAGANDSFEAAHHQQHTSESGLYPVASIDERRLAGIIDLICLLFAYGGFLSLFGSLGGEFTVSKLSAAVCVATFAIVYLQYFALFTVFGGTTPGMMFRGLQVVSFSGEPPTSRQLLQRSAGYILSAGTLFLGFLWAMWDEDSLTWHDRVSRTYLSFAQTYADLEAQSVAQPR